MLTHWIFVMLIGGQSVVMDQEVSEADCNRALAHVVTASRLYGKDAVGTCYLQATADV